MRPTRSVSIAGLLLGCAASGTVSSAVIHSLEVERNRGRYELVADTHLAAPAEAIFDVLMDYDDGRFGRISSVYKESDYLEPAADGTPLVYTLMKGCVLFFCKSMRRVERLESERPHFIRTTALPEDSDFKYSRSEWELESVEGGTNVKYRLVMEPDFWVPPVVGPWVLKRTLMEGGTRAINRIERLARGLPSDVPRPDGPGSHDRSPDIRSPDSRSTDSRSTEGRSTQGRSSDDRSSDDRSPD